MPLRISTIYTALTMGTLSLAKFWSSHIAGCQLIERNSKKTERESFDKCTDLKLSTCMVRWYGNKGIHLESTFSSVGSSSSKKHWDPKKENHVNVTTSRYD